MTTVTESFASGHAAEAEWPQAVEACATRLGGLSPAANVGFVYVAEPFADALDLIGRELAQRTGVPFWVGAAGFGVCGTGVEFMGAPAITAIAGYLPEDRFALFDGVREPGGGLAPDVAEWAAQRNGTLAVVHGSPAQPDLPGSIERLAAASGSFLVGGIGAPTAGETQIAGTATGGGLSGILIAAEQPVITGLSQGCRPIGPFRRATQTRGALVARLDDLPAVQALRDDFADNDPREILPFLHVALAVEGSDRPDYLVRNLAGVDPDSGAIAVAGQVEEGARLAFVRRDAAAARADLERMLDDLGHRLDGRTPRAALYHACVARGRNLFEADGVELGLIRERIGDVPLAGFFANGEIFHDRLYGYTGVLTLLL